MASGASCGNDGGHPRVRIEGVGRGYVESNGNTIQGAWGVYAAIEARRVCRLLSSEAVGGDVKGDWSRWVKGVAVRYTMVAISVGTC